MKILVIGNSHSNDTFWLLHEVFADQIPEQEVVLGALYYSGCSVSRHVQFATENKNVYRYHSNIDGVWNTVKEATMDTGLCDQPWDVVVFQGGRGDRDNETDSGSSMCYKFGFYSRGLFSCEGKGNRPGV